MDKIVAVDKNNISIIAPLFDGMQDTAVWSCLQGRNYARAWVDDVYSPTCAAAMIGGMRPETGGFAFFAGKADGDQAIALVKRWRSDVSGGHVIVPHGDDWENIIETALGDAASKHKRYATSKREHKFDRAKLSAWASSIPEGYTMKRIDRNLFDLCMNGGWSLDNVGNFTDFDQFASDGHGMGFAAMLGGEPVSIASPYSAYDGGIEIEIDTRGDHRRKGLARACASRLILECLENGLYPSWDAANRESISLAQQLGYIMTEEYTAYFCKCGSSDNDR